MALTIAAYFGEHITKLALESPRKYSISACVLPVLKGIAHKPADQVDS